MDAGSIDFFAATVTDLRDGRHGLIYEVGPERIAVDVGNHWTGAAKEAVNYVRYVFG